MDDLVENFAASFAVSNAENATFLPHPRFAEYKPKRSGSSQIERRLALLQEQKKKRMDFVDGYRHLAEEIFHLTRENNKKKNEAYYRNRLMLSEWLVDIPADLSTAWKMVPCPEGRRSLIVARQGVTECYTKQGHRLFTFSSVLPGGNSMTRSTKYITMLDCIWCAYSNEFFILDILAWGNQPLLDCDTNFRFYWLETKYFEIPGLGEKSLINCYPFRPLPRVACNATSMSSLLKLYPLYPDNIPKIDGILFYHGDCHYTPGSTPLVGWLKPYMIPDLLGIPIADEYMEGKGPYLSLAQNIEEEEKKMQQNRKGKQQKKSSERNNRKMKMDVEPTDNKTPQPAKESSDATETSIDISDAAETSLDISDAAETSLDISDAAETSPVVSNTTLMESSDLTEMESSEATTNTQNGN